MQRALILNAVDMRIGGVLIRGERGTGKSTAARALAALLPEVDVIADSPFNDDPNSPGTWSDISRDRYADTPTLIIGTHFAGPTAGHLVRDGDAYRLMV